MCILRNPIAYLSLNIINLDDLDFSERRSEEVIRPLALSVYNIITPATPSPCPLLVRRWIPPIDISLFFCCHSSNQQDPDIDREECQADVDCRTDDVIITGNGEFPDLAPSLSFQQIMLCICYLCLVICV